MVMSIRYGILSIIYCEKNASHSEIQSKQWGNPKSQHLTNDSIPQNGWIVYNKFVLWKPMREKRGETFGVALFATKNYLESVSLHDKDAKVQF